jgi:hypothetical protein
LEKTQYASTTSSLGVSLASLPCCFIGMDGGLWWFELTSPIHPSGESRCGMNGTTQRRCTPVAVTFNPQLSLLGGKLIHSSNAHILS